MAKREHCSQSRSSIPCHEGVHIFHIDHFPQLEFKSKVHEATESPEFTTAGNKWKLRVYPGGESEENKEWVAAYLASAQGTHDVKVYFEISTSPSFNEVAYRTNFVVAKPGNAQGWPRLVKRTEAVDAAKARGGTLSIKLSFIIWGERSNRSKPTPVAHHTVRDALKHELQKGDGDVEILTTDGTLRAHALLLGLRSPVLKAMLDGPMQESRARTVPLDADSATATALLHFVYTDDCALLEDPDGVCHLLKLAHYLQVEELVQQCTVRIEAALSEPGPAVEKLLLADELGLEQVRETCAAFLADPDVLAKAQTTEEWQRLVSQRPQLLARVMQKLVAPKPQKRKAEDPYAGLTVVQLRERCRQRGLATDGSKAVLLDRLRDADAA